MGPQLWNNLNNINFKNKISFKIIWYTLLKSCDTFI